MQASKQAINLDNSLIYISYQRIKILIIYLHRYLFEFSFFFFTIVFNYMGFIIEKKKRDNFFPNMGCEKGLLLSKKNILPTSIVYLYFLNSYWHPIVQTLARGSGVAKFRKFKNNFYRRGGNGYTCRNGQKFHAYYSRGLER